MEGDVLAGALGLPSLAAFAGAVLAGVFGLLSLKVEELKTDGKRRRANTYSDEARLTWV
jgi:hypothetical protein